MTIGPHTSLEAYPKYNISTTEKQKNRKYIWNHLYETILRL